MSIERRYALLRHHHDDDYAALSHTHTFTEVTGGLVSVESGSPTVRFTETGVTANNGKFDITADGEDLKFRLLSDALTAVDFMVVNRTSNSCDAVRVVTSLMHLDGASLALTDGLAAPGNINGLALLYVDTADGDLKVKFGDGHTRVLAPDTDVSLTALSFSNGWAAYSSGAGFSSPGYYKDHNGRVHLKGLIQHITSAPTADEVMFTLPAGFRPLDRLVLTGIAGGDGGTEGRVQRVDIKANGEVLYLTQIAAGAANTFISLDGMSFLAQQ